MTKESKILLTLAALGTSTIAGSYVYYNQKTIKLREEAVNNEKLYFEKLTPEQVENLEKEKINLEKERLLVEKARLELKNTETELKKTVTDFEAKIRTEIEKKVMTSIHDDMRSTFDDWSSKFENRMENKVDNVITRIDNLSDKYGGVKQASTPVAPTISVVNAPNN